MSCSNSGASRKELWAASKGFKYFFKCILKLQLVAEGGRHCSLEKKEVR